MSDIDKDIDYKAWALDLCALLDEIEKRSDDADKVYELLRLRFKLAEKHGMKVLMLGPANTHEH